MEIEDWPDVENCPHRPDEQLTVFGVEASHVVVTSADGLPYRAKCLPSCQSPPLRPGDRVVVDTVYRDRTVVERVTQGHRDGCQYALFAYQLVSAEA